MKILFPSVTVAAFALCIVPCVLWLRKTHAAKLPYFIGMLTFFLFVKVLEALVHNYCLLRYNLFSAYLNAHPVAFMLYGGFAAGIFEETGRFVAFKTLLRRYDAPETAITYGLGHGSIEIILTVALGYLFITLSFYSRGTLLADRFSFMRSAVDSIIAAPYLSLVALEERAVALLFHVSASVFVFRAVWDRERRWLYPLAIVLHAVLDFPAALYTSGLISLFLTELVTAEFSIITALFAFQMYRHMKAERTVPQEAPPEISVAYE